ncbi:MAG TPA: cupin domain-containing protein [Burkholderiaceae bacterium]|nr:cupin domain-containing protein [Burkholderiaceae bacterium]
MADIRHSRALQRLGNIPVAHFMRDAWQRKPLLIRAALRGFNPPVDRARLLQLARQPDAEVRLVERERGRWSVRHGPLSALPSTLRRKWTVLVQGVDLLDAGAHALLQRFRFVPDARLDDMMASYATDGGGVGPHVDSYDVFLLQAHGRRRWRISRQRDLRLVHGAPLQVLAEFRPTREFVLDPGDMLYLPPGVAHEGTALGECITYSIGFRAPTHQELLEPYYSELATATLRRGRYQDRGLAPTRRPGALPDAMVEQLHAALMVHVKEADTARFLLGHLSEPKVQVIFDRPARPLQRVAFSAQARRRGLELDRRTRLLYRGSGIGVNGQFLDLAHSYRGTLQRLSDRRWLAPIDLEGPLLDLLHDWYRSGWLHLAPSST